MKLTPEAVEIIRTCRRKQKHYAQQFGVSISTISRVQSGERWPATPEPEDFDDDEVLDGD